MIAQLAVAAAVYAIDKPYSYRVPEGMQVQPGLRVLVPFGRGNRRSEAVVLALQDTAQRDLKVIECALDDAPILSQAQLQLAAFMKERYFCTFYEAVKAILPAGFWFAEKKTLTLAPGAQDKLPPGMANSDAARLVQLLQEFGGSAPERRRPAARPSRSPPSPSARRRRSSSPPKSRPPRRCRRPCCGCCAPSARAPAARSAP